MHLQQNTTGMKKPHGVQVAGSTWHNKTHTETRKIYKMFTRNRAILHHFNTPVTTTQTPQKRDRNLRPCPRHRTVENSPNPGNGITAKALPRNLHRRANEVKTPRRNREFTEKSATRSTYSRRSKYTVNPKQTALKLCGRKNGGGGNKPRPENDRGLITPGTTTGII